MSYSGAFKIMRALVAETLVHATEREWTLQGLGMLRTYLSEDIRLHVWSDQHVAEAVSEIHDHPWHFRSTVIAGQLINTRYAASGKGDPYHVQQLRCGQGGGLIGNPELLRLAERQTEIVLAGETYAQGRTEIHRSMPMAGTVTIIERLFDEDTEHARVFWREGEQWGTAEPRPATADEVRDITRMALDRWFS